MLYDPKWNKPSLSGFIDWLESQPSDGQYNYSNAHKCALAQYGESIGMRCKDTNANFNRLHEVVLGAVHNDVVRARPWTFGAALERARAIGQSWRITAMSEHFEMKVDPARANAPSATGIVVRAKNGDKWGSFDIAELDRQSLDFWLKSRGGDNPWAEGVVAMLLGHPHC